MRPLLARHCYECHSGKAKKLKAGLRLDSRTRVLEGGDSGPAVVPGKPKQSLLIKGVRWQGLEMPPRRKLSDEQVAVLVRWVELGAPWPPDREKPKTTDPGNYNWAKLRDEHWAFRPVRKPRPPQVDSSWATTPLDRFVLTRLQRAGLKPAPSADAPTLIRRVYFDLVGLPPTPGQVDQFVQAAKKDRHLAVKQVVEELLDSPLYGQRWARHWLDVARYSDGFGGFSDNAALPQAWRYRDWVVEAFNRDLPYDQFVKLQIAGDLMKTKDGAVATGFFALGPTYKSDGGDPDSVAQAKSETLDDRIDTLSRGFLGLTVSCARCHDHKFDPIPQIDYYSLAGVFNNTRVIKAPAAAPAVVKAYHDHQQAIKAADQKIKRSEGGIRKQKRQPTGEEKKELDRQKAELARLKKTAPPMYDWTHALAESGSADMKVALRGNLRKPGKVAPRRFLRILAGEKSPRFTRGSGRLELAEAIADARNPLTARVLVNRVWRLHFGRALVRSPSNFGSLGEQPTHPELLDWLAARFIESGWSIKQLHRTIMLSAAYQMSSRFDAAKFRADGDNRLIWRMNPRRLDVEAWRDGLLTVTGELDRALGGPPTENVNSRRRTLYLKVSRNGDRFGSDIFLRLFDFPLMRATVARRPISIVPQQYLFMMNGPFMIDRAKALAKRLQREASGDAERIDRAYQLLFGRLPSEEEKQLGLAFLGNSQPTPAEKAPPKDASPKDANKEQNDILIADFEGETYGEWKTEGQAFGPGPAQGTLPRQMAVTGFLGRGLVNTYYKGDGATGTLTSPKLKISRRYVNFLVGGGKYAGKTCINLLIDDKIVRTAAGPNDKGGGSERLGWHTWDVREFIGKMAVIEIVDRRTGGWGHINVDHIYQSNKPPDEKIAPSNAVDSRPRPALSLLQQYAQVLLSSNEFMQIR